MIVGLSNFSCAKFQCKLVLNESFTGKVLNGPKITSTLLFFSSNFVPRCLTSNVTASRRSSTQGAEIFVYIVSI